MLTVASWGRPSVDGAAGGGGGGGGGSTAGAADSAGGAGAEDEGAEEDGTEELGAGDDSDGPVSAPHPTNPVRASATSGAAYLTRRR
jgi:hypothetical protein